MRSKMIRSNYSEHQSLSFKVLSEGQCERIFEAALEVLERTGIEMHSEEGLSLLKKAGCRIDGNRVRIPSFLIKWALNIAPSRIVLCDRNGKRQIFLEGHNSYFGPGPTNPNFIDLESGQRRKVVQQDVINTARISDALTNIDFVMSLAMVSDCNPLLADVYEVYAMLQNTSKPIISWGFDVDGYRDIIEMCSAVAGGLEELQRNPFIVLYSEPATPLTHPKESIDKLLFLAERNLPVIYTPGMQLGATVPVTIAGALAVGVADNLTGLLVGQLKQEGSPIICAAPMGVMDMKSMQCSYGAPEFILGHAASTDVYHYLGLPIWSTAGATDSKIIDEQGAIEAALGCMIAALGGAHLIHDVGFMEMGMSASLEQLIMGDEIIGMVRRLVAGVEVNDDTLALDLIDEIGPGGNFISSQHTFANFRKEIWMPTVMDRLNHSEWEKNGQKTMKQRLNEKARAILHEHKPNPLPDNVIQQLDAIINRAEKRVNLYTNKG